MSMMQIRVVRMGVCHHLVVMDMRVRFAGRIRRFMGMLMMLIVPMQMFMNQWFMAMQMGVALGKMDPDPQHHQPAGPPKEQGSFLV